MKESVRNAIAIGVMCSVSYLAVYLARNILGAISPQMIENGVFIILAVLSSNCASSMLWSRYCPSLRDTGMVSSATGFLDFVSYIAAAVSSSLFANAVSKIGWGNLILVWFGLMFFGVVVSLPMIRKEG